jgi:hypothetical protein
MVQAGECGVKVSCKGSALAIGTQRQKDTFAMQVQPPIHSLLHQQQQQHYLELQADKYVYLAHLQQQMAVASDA